VLLRRIGDPGGGTASVQTIFDVTFDLTTPITYQIVMQTSSSHGPWMWALRDSNGLALASGSGSIGGANGSLAAGRYSLHYQFDGVHFGVLDSFDGFLDMRVTPIPEPGTAALLALGLGALAATRRWRGSAS
jgi:PEP-CTERM motif